MGLALGSAFDGGRAWKVKGGVVVQSGPRHLVYARGDMFGDPPSLTRANCISQSGFAAACGGVDGIEDQLTVDLRYERKTPASGKTLHVRPRRSRSSPTSTKAPRIFVHLGQHCRGAAHPGSPLQDARPVVLTIMVDGRGIPNLAAHSEIDVPGTAVATWASAAAGRKASRAAASAATSGSSSTRTSYARSADIELIAGAVVVDGGLGLKVFGLGFELHVYADLAWLLGRIWGKDRCGVGRPVAASRHQGGTPVRDGRPDALPEPSAFTLALTMTRPGERRV
jgi:hypothetical protein